MTSSTAAQPAPTTSTGTSTSGTVSPAPAGTVRRRRGKVRSTDSAPRWAHFVLAPLALVWMVPVAMVIGLSLLPTWNPSTTALGMFPAEPTLSNYITIWQDEPIFQHVLNSLIIAVPSVLMTLFFGAMAAFALARLRVPLKSVIFGGLILALILPMASIVVATFKILQSLSLYNNLLGVSLVYTALGLPFAVIIFRTAFAAIPYETFEAARMDGASYWRIFVSIYLPLGKAAAAVVVIWQLMMSWNDFLLPLVAISDNELKPLTLVPLAYRGIYLSQPGALFAILVLISVPIVIVYALMQRNLVNGLAGSVK